MNVDQKKLFYNRIVKKFIVNLSDGGWRGELKVQSEIFGKLNFQFFYETMRNHSNLTYIKEEEYL